MMYIYIVCPVVAAVIGAAVYLLCARTFGIKLRQKDRELEMNEALWRQKLSAAEAVAAADREKGEALLAAAERRTEQVKKSYDEMLQEIKRNSEQSLKQQVEAIKSEMKAQTEEVLKAREDELHKKADETFKNISGTLGRDLEAMKKSFDENKKTQMESAESLKSNLENAVKNLRERTEDIGNKADHLADALKGRNKMQGCFGETILENLLVAEGFREHVDYDKEFVLRDEMGIAVANEDSGKRMRPDLIIHYPDKTDVVVDSKVDLKALSDWNDAADSAAKEDAAKRNLAAVRAQVDNLAKKDYTGYIGAGRKSLGYVLMFVPIYNAYQLAKSLDPDLWRDAFRRNVLITTEETIVPFLRMIRTAWRNAEQIRNQQNIIKAAEEMISRVHDMALAHAKMGKKLGEVSDAYEACDRKLRDSGQSIIVSARKVIDYGVRPRAGKELPEVTEPSAPQKEIDSGDETETT